MRTTPIRNSALLVALTAGLAWSHPSGFHKRLTVTVTPERLSVLVVMDVDSGERCLLLREAVDADRDGTLSKDEVARLKDRLVKLAIAPLKLGVSGAPIALDVKDTKVSLRDDRRANDAPLSVAVLLEVETHGKLRPGMELELTDTAPDTSGIALQVFQEGQPQPFEREVPSGVTTRVEMQRPAR